VIALCRHEVSPALWLLLQVQHLLSGLPAGGGEQSVGLAAGKARLLAGLQVRALGLACDGRCEQPCRTLLAAALLAKGQ